MNIEWLEWSPTPVHEVESDGMDVASGRDARQAPCVVGVKSYRAVGEPIEIGCGKLAAVGT